MSPVWCQPKRAASGITPSRMPDGPGRDLVVIVVRGLDTLEGREAQA